MKTLVAVNDAKDIWYKNVKVSVVVPESLIVRVCRLLSKVLISEGCEVQDTVDVTGQALELVN